METTKQNDIITRAPNWISIAALLLTVGLMLSAHRCGREQVRAEAGARARHHQITTQPERSRFDSVLMLGQGDRTEQP